MIPSSHPREHDRSNVGSDLTSLSSLSGGTSGSDRPDSAGELTPHIDSTNWDSRSLSRRNAVKGIALLSTACWLGKTASDADANEKDAAATPAAEMVRIRFKTEDSEKVVTGEVVTHRPVFGDLILDADGVLTAVSPDELVSIESLSQQLVPTKHAELAHRLLALMPEGSRTLSSDQFLLCFNTTEAYARWNADLYTRLFRGLNRYWKSKGLEFNAPRFPLVALLFETKADYVRYASQEFQGAENTYGYYHQGTNRLASYDLTGVEGLVPSGARVNRDMLVQQILSRPEAERTVATVVHEACHQIAFNCGIQTRLGNNPLWLSEGLATYFEAPDLTGRGGWGGIGRVNQHNYTNLMQYLRDRPADSLTLLLSDDSRLRQAATMREGYAEAWGLTHFLLQTKSKEFVKYLQAIREVPIGEQISGKERIDLFCSCFGEDLAKLDREFLRHVQRIR